MMESGRACICSPCLICLTLTLGQREPYFQNSSFGTISMAPLRIQSGPAGVGSEKSRLWFKVKLWSLAPHGTLSRGGGRGPDFLSSSACRSVSIETAARCGPRGRPLLGTIRGKSPCAGPQA